MDNEKKKNKIDAVKKKSANYYKDKKIHMDNKKKKY